MALKLGNGKKCIVPSPAGKPVPVLEGGDSFQDMNTVWSTEQGPPAIDVAPKKEQWEVWGAIEAATTDVSEVISGDLQLEEVLPCFSISQKPETLYNFVRERKS